MLHELLPFALHYVFLSSAMYWRWTIVTC